MLERLRFLSISANNLDEFYTVRVAGLRELAQAGNTTPAADGLSPAEQLVLINENARNLMANQQRVLVDLMAEMDAQNIMLERSADLTDEAKTQNRDIIRSQFPFINQLGGFDAGCLQRVHSLFFASAMMVSSSGIQKNFCRFKRV